MSSAEHAAWHDLRAGHRVHAPWPGARLPAAVAAHARPRGRPHGRRRRAGARAMSPPALALAHLSKRFGGLPAARDVSLTVMAGERRLIIGPNGAGKTTLFNLI